MPEEALARSSRIDLAPTDIDLGRCMDGMEATTLMLEERDLPVVFLSSHSEPAIGAKAERITSYGYAAERSGFRERWRASSGAGARG